MLCTVCGRELIDGVCYTYRCTENPYSYTEIKPSTSKLKKEEIECKVCSIQPAIDLGEEIMGAGLHICLLCADTKKISKSTEYAGGSVNRPHIHIYKNAPGCHLKLGNVEHRFVNVKGEFNVLNLHSAILDAQSRSELPYWLPWLYAALKYYGII